MAVLVATRRKLVSHTPPSDADASVTGWLHCDAPSNAHGPPSDCQDRTASAATHALGTTTRAAPTRHVVTGTDNSRCANHPAGSHSTPRPAANSTSIGPALVTSQYWVASTNPPIPVHARSAPSHDVGAARTTNSSGTKQVVRPDDGLWPVEAGGLDVRPRAGPPQPRGRLGHHLQCRASWLDQDQPADRGTVPWPRQAGADGTLVQDVLAFRTVPLAGDRRGILPALYAAATPQADGGAFYGPRGRYEVAGGGVREAKVPAAARNDADSKRLWEVSEQLTGVSYPKSR